MTRPSKIDIVAEQYKANLLTDISPHLMPAGCVTWLTWCGIAVYVDVIEVSRN